MSPRRRGRLVGQGHAGAVVGEPGAGSARRQQALLRLALEWQAIGRCKCQPDTGSGTSGATTLCCHGRQEYVWLVSP